MEAEYINDVVGSALAEAIASAHKLKPEDPVNYFGTFLINFADSLDRLELGVTAIAVDNNAAPLAPSTADITAVSTDEDQYLAEQEAILNSILSESEEITPVVLDKFASTLSQITSTEVYIAEKIPSVDEEGESRARIRYIGAFEGFDKDVVVTEPAGVTFKSWVLPGVVEDEEENNEDEEEEAPLKPVVVPELPVVYIPNVLKDRDVVFHSVPRPGAFFVAPAKFESSIHDASVPSAEELAEAAEVARAAAEAASAEAGESGESAVEAAVAEPELDAEGNPILVSEPVHPIPKAKTITKYIAVCADTLSHGSGSSISEKTRELLKRAAKLLAIAMESTEAALFEAEYRSFYATIASPEEAQAALESLTNVAAAAEELTLQKQQERIAELTRARAAVSASSLSSSSESAEAAAAADEDAEPSQMEETAEPVEPLELPDDVQGSLKAAATLEALEPLVSASFEVLGARVGRRRVAAAPAVQRLVELLHLLAGGRAEELVDSSDSAAVEGAAAAAAQGALLPAFWPALRVIASNLAAQLQHLTPDVLPVKKQLAYHSVDVLRGLLESISKEEVASAEPGLVALLPWAQAQLDARQSALQRKQREKEEEAARIEAEIEAKRNARLAHEEEAEE